MLYIAVGENATPSNAQTKTNLLGKILRVSPTGAIPTDNPFYSSASGKNRAIWALGLRNPFTFAVQPGTGRIFINDVGQNTTEEVDEGVAGANYGWPTTEGPTTDPRFDSPVYSYPHGSECAITGGAFYNPSTGPVSEHVRRRLLHRRLLRQLDQTARCGRFVHRRLELSRAASRSRWASPWPRTAASTIWLGARERTQGGVFRIQYTLNTPPAITVQPLSKTVTVGELAAFSVSASGTPPLSYQWQHNGANISGATSASYTIASAQLADNAATFRCRVTNAYGNVTSSSATLSVTANLAPVAAITSPGNGATYAGGQTIYYSGTGTDPEDGTLPASAFEWEVVFHHDTHTHPVHRADDGSQERGLRDPDDGRDLGQRLVSHPSDGHGLERPDERGLSRRLAAQVDDDLRDRAVGAHHPARWTTARHTRHGDRRGRHRAHARGGHAAEQGGS
jgi:hypothetical protein